MTGTSETIGSQTLTAAGAVSYRSARTVCTGLLALSVGSFLGSYWMYKRMDLLPNSANLIPDFTAIYQSWMWGLAVATIVVWCAGWSAGYRSLRTGNCCAMPGFLILILVPWAGADYALIPAVAFYYAALVRAFVDAWQRKEKPGKLMFAGSLATAGITIMLMLMPLLAKLSCLYLDEAMRSD